MGTLYVVATPIGNLKDITYNAIEVLTNVNYVACEDTRNSIHLLTHYNIKNKLIAYYKFNDTSKLNEIIELVQNNDVVIITDAGTPCISDPGSILVREAVKNNIKVIGICGASALVNALSVSGMDTSSFTFYGFLSRENKGFNEDMEKILNDSSKVAVIYESPKRIIKTLTKMQEYFSNSFICVCNDLTKKFEKKYYGTIDEVIDSLNNNENSELGEYVILIEKKEKISKITDDVSIEALLVDKMVKKNITMKESIEQVTNENKLSKKDVYNASLNIKKI